MKNSATLMSPFSPLTCVVDYWTHSGLLAIGHLRLTPKPFRSIVSYFVLVLCNSVLNVIRRLFHGSSGVVTFSTL